MDTANLIKIYEGLFKQLKDTEKHYTNVTDPSQGIWVVN